MSTPLSIKQFAHNYTVYPEVPLQVSLPSPTTAKSLLALLVFGHRTNYGFNVGEESAETVAPVITDDGGNTWTLLKYILNIVQDYGTSPPVISPDASGNYPSIYLFVAPTSGNLKSGGTTVWVTDAGLDQSPPTVSPPIEFGRPVFDSGIRAVLLECAGTTGATGTQTAVDVSDSYIGVGTVVSGSTVLGYQLINPGSDNELVVEAGVLIDSSALGLGAKASYLTSSSYPAGSSYWLIQQTLQGTKARSAGFPNPIAYMGAVVAVALA
jgi:hypothetical protein